MPRRFYREAAVAKVGIKAFFDPKIAFVTGPENAKTTLAEFFDYNCPYCRASVPALKKFYEAHKKDTRFAFIEFPSRARIRSLRHAPRLLRVSSRTNISISISR